MVAAFARSSDGRTSDTNISGPSLGVGLLAPQSPASALQPASFGGDLLAGAELRCVIYLNASDDRDPSMSRTSP